MFQRLFLFFIFLGTFAYPIEHANIEENKEISKMVHDAYLEAITSEEFSNIIVFEYGLEKLNLGHLFFKKTPEIEKAFYHSFQTALENGDWMKIYELVTEGKKIDIYLLDLLPGDLSPSLQLGIEKVAKEGEEEGLTWLIQLAEKKNISWTISEDALAQGILLHSLDEGESQTKSLLECAKRFSEPREESYKRMIKECLKNSFNDLKSETLLLSFDEDSFLEDEIQANSTSLATEMNFCKERGISFTSEEIIEIENFFDSKATEILMRADVDEVLPFFYLLDQAKKIGIFLDLAKIEKIDEKLLALWKKCIAEDAQEEMIQIEWAFRKYDIKWNSAKNPELVKNYQMALKGYVERNVLDAVEEGDFDRIPTFIHFSRERGVEIVVKNIFQIQEAFLKGTKNIPDDFFLAKYFQFTRKYDVGLDENALINTCILQQIASAETKNVKRVLKSLGDKQSNIVLKKIPGIEQAANEGYFVSRDNMATQKELVGFLSKYGVKIDTYEASMQALVRAISTGNIFEIDDAITLFNKSDYCDLGDIPAIKEMFINGCKSCGDRGDLFGIEYLLQLANDNNIDLMEERATIEEIIDQSIPHSPIISPRFTEKELGRLMVRWMETKIFELIKPFMKFL